jgi:hypothetical protein
MDTEKVREIRRWPSPRSTFEVRSFHGIARFYRKFVQNFSDIGATMIYTVNKIHKSFKWIEEDDKIFNILKEKIREQLILVFLDFGKTFQVRCDVSGVAIGVVLSQDNRHVAYFSENLNDNKRK